jgi:hypothetical protein
MRAKSGNGIDVYTIAIFFGCSGMFQDSQVLICMQKGDDEIERDGAGRVALLNCADALEAAEADFIAVSFSHS